MLTEIQKIAQATPLVWWRNCSAPKFHKYIFETSVLSFALMPAICVRILKNNYSFSRIGEFLVASITVCLILFVVLSTIVAAALGKTSKFAAVGNNLSYSYIKMMTISAFLLVMQLLFIYIFRPSSNIVLYTFYSDSRDDVIYSMIYVIVYTTPAALFLYLNGRSYLVRRANLIKEKYDGIGNDRLESNLRKENTYAIVVVLSTTITVVCSYYWIIFGDLPRILNTICC